MNRDIEWTGPDGATIAFALVTVVGAFLPWVTVAVDGGPVDVTARNAGIEGLGLLTLVLGVVGIAVVLLDPENLDQPLISTLVGLGVLLIGVLKLLELSGPADPGLGLYLTLLGGIGLAVAGLWGYRTTNGGGIR